MSNDDNIRALARFISDVIFASSPDYGEVVRALLYRGQTFEEWQVSFLRQMGDIMAGPLARITKAAECDRDALLRAIYAETRKRAMSDKT
jgi:hypothetical protein